MSRLTSVVLPAPVGPTMATVSPASRDEVEVLDERLVGLVAERDVLERDRAARAAEHGAARPGRAISSASSSSSNTRSADATADWRTLTMLAVWMIGNVNWREYWMNAIDVAERHLAGRDPQAADDRDRDVVEVGDEVHRGLDDAGDELRPVARLVEPLVLLVELRDRLVLAAEHLDDGVPGVHLLDVAVERAGRGPLGDELLLRTARR